MTALVIMWVSALLSAVVDNIPFTVTMIPIIAHLETQGVDVMPLWWALALGVGLGGNGSHIGSTANVICVSRGRNARASRSTVSRPGCGYKRDAGDALDPDGIQPVADTVFRLLSGFLSRLVRDKRERGTFCFAGSILLRLSDRLTQNVPFFHVVFRKSGQVPLLAVVCASMQTALLVFLATATWTRIISTHPRCCSTNRLSH